VQRGDEEVTRGERIPGSLFIRGNNFQEPLNTISEKGRESGEGSTKLPQSPGLENKKSAQEGGRGEGNVRNSRRGPLYPDGPVLKELAGKPASG